jgi:C-methyltransferase
MTSVSSKTNDSGVTEISEAAVHLRELALSAAGPAAVCAAIRLGIADELGETPTTAEQLAQSLEVNVGVLERLLRTLKNYGVFAEVGNGYVHTASSRLLREDDPYSLKFCVQWLTESWTWALWPHLDKAVCTGRGVFEDMYGTDFFTYLHKEWPESAVLFNKSQTQASRLSAIAVADRLDLKGVRILADIAGGQGYTLAALLEKNPQLNGVLVDLPSVVADPDPRLRTGGFLVSRVQLVGGDCLQEIPVAADVYLFKNILEFDDEKSVTMLRNAGRAGNAGARVFIITNLIDDSPEIKCTTGLDLLLLLNVNGKKHTKSSKHSPLLSACGDGLM